MSRRSEILEDITLRKDAWTERTTAAGHVMEWELDRQYLHWYGRCANCGSTMSVFDGGTSIGEGARCARDIDCPGPGTAWQEEMLRERQRQLITGAVSEFGQAVKDNYDREWLRSQGLGE